MKVYYLAKDIDNELVEFETEFNTIYFIAEEAAEHIASDGDSETLQLFPMKIEIFNAEKTSLGVFMVEHECVSSFMATKI